MRHRATSRKVARSNHDEVVNFFFNLPYHSSSTIVLELTPLLTEMSTRNLSGK
jgi:hypothetical protein